MRATSGRGRGTVRGASRRRRIARVETLESRRLLATFTVTSAADTVGAPGTLTLRQAITAANDESLNPGPDEIVFAIPQTTPPSGPVRQIRLNDNLPPITAPLVIRGATQPGYAGTPLIQLERSDDTSATLGFQVQAPDVAIDALAIVSFPTAGINVVESGRLTLTSSYVGLDANGNAGRGNGIGVILASPGSYLGGAAAGDGNVISGNLTNGVQISGPNGDGNVLAANRIGTTVDGLAAAPNGADGVLLVGGADSNVIGGTAAGAGNRIAFNAGIGVHLLQVIDPDLGTLNPFGNAILGNSITQNAGLGIDLDPPPGPNPPDAGGPNGGQNFPVLTSAVFDGLGLIVEGTLTAPAGRTYRVEFFADPGDATGYGEGAQFLGSTSVNVTTTGTATFRVELPAVALPSGVVTATATSPVEGTSEFSLGRAAVERISFTVINTNNAGRGSLRQAILNANRVPGRQLIDFRIPSSLAQDGCYIIQPLTALPPITEAVDLDATTQPGYLATPRVELQGQRVGTVPSPVATADGLAVLANDVRVAGLAINRFSGAAIRVEESSRAVLEGLHVGVDCTGQLAPGNAGGGIVLAMASDSRIGGLTADLRNVVSGNRGPGGIVLQDGSTGNRIVNNLIGTDRSGARPRPNTVGVAVLSSSANAIGAAGAGLGNLISANGTGVAMANASGNVILGNLVGTDAAGQRLVGSQSVGILLANAGGNAVGSAGGLGGNLVAGHEVGVRIQGAGSTGNQLLGNLIGTDAAGRSGLGNAIGVHIVDAGRNTIGGGAGAANVLSGNAIVGVRLDGAGATGNAILGNRIGTDRAGRAAVPNGFDGVFVLAPGNRIAGNIVSGNASTGIQLFGANAQGNVVEGNFVGTDVSGTRPLGNRRDGIYVNGAPGNTIRNNLVSANGSTGIQIFGTRARDNLVVNNRVGTDAAGRVARGLGNRFGLFLNGAGANRIGGAGGENRVAGNINAAIFTSIAGSAAIVEGVQPEIVGGRLVAVSLTFSRDMDSRSATDRANYRLRTANGTDPGIAAVTYDPDRRTITVVLATPLSNPSGTRIVVNASGPRGVRSDLGLLLDGNRDGRPGSDFAAVLTA